MPKLNLHILFVLPLLLLSGLAPAQEKAYTTVSGSVFFRSDAKLEKIEAKSTALKGILKPGTGEFAFSILINSFDGFNGELQKEHFRENYMETDRFPKASFEGRMIEKEDVSRSGNYDIRAKGMLNIHGVAMERIIKVNIISSESQIKVRAIFSVFLNDHAILIPKVVQQKIAEEIYVEVDAVFKLRSSP